MKKHIVMLTPFVVPFVVKNNLNKSHSGICMLGFLFSCLTYPMQGMADDKDTYHYMLEQNKKD